MSPDFEALRAQRNAAAKDVMETVARQMGWVDNKPFGAIFNPNDCYCDCLSGGPCEHSFKRWRQLGDCAGERVCSRCGMGAIGHSLRCGE